MTFQNTVLVLIKLKQCKVISGFTISLSISVLLASKFCYAIGIYLYLYQNSLLHVQNYIQNYISTGQ